jgi:hypothetical protein
MKNSKYGTMVCGKIISFALLISIYTNCVEKAFMDKPFLIA